MIRVTDRTGDTYTTTGPVTWAVLWSFKWLGVILFALIGVVIVIFATLWQWLERRFPRAMGAISVIIGAYWALLILGALNVAIAQIVGGWGGYLAAALFDVALVTGIIALARSLDVPPVAPAAPAAPPTGSVPTSAPPLSGSEKIRQTRGWS